MRDVADARVARPGADQLGDGPCWDVSAQELIWVDITAGLIHRWNPQHQGHTAIGIREPVSFAIPREGGGLVIGTPSTVTLLEEDGARHRLTDMEPALVDNRCNDGKCDARGRLWAGTIGSLFSYESGCRGLPAFRVAG